MSEKLLPTVAASLRNLRASGDQFASAPLAPRPLGGFAYTQERGPVNVEVDDRVLRATNWMYVHERALRLALQSRGAQALDIAVGLKVIRRYFRDIRVMWGVSGYAMAGPNCNAEADGLEALYGHFTSANAHRPSLVVCGGGGAGALGISGVLAEVAHIPSFGVTPLQGLASMAPRTHTMVYGRTFQDREVMVGLLPDVLVVVGGRDGAMRETVLALKAGATVLMLAPKRGDDQALTARWSTIPGMARAERSGQLIVCQSLTDIASNAEKARLRALRTYRETRAVRLGAITRRLGALS